MVRNRGSNRYGSIIPRRTDKSVPVAWRRDRLPNIQSGAELPLDPRLLRSAWLCVSGGYSRALNITFICGLPKRLPGPAPHLRSWDAHLKAAANSRAPSGIKGVCGPAAGNWRCSGLLHGSIQPRPVQLAASGLVGADPSASGFFFFPKKPPLSRRVSWVCHGRRPYLHGQTAEFAAAFAPIVNGPSCC